MENKNFGECFRFSGIYFKQEAYVPFVFDSVYLMSKALHIYIEVQKISKYSDVLISDFRSLVEISRIGTIARFIKMDLMDNACRHFTGTFHYFVI